MKITKKRKNEHGAIQESKVLIRKKKKKKKKPREVNTLEELSLNETFTDGEHRKMFEMKGKLSWHDFILLMFTHCLDSQKKGDFEVHGK